MPLTGRPPVPRSSCLPECGLQCNHMGQRTGMQPKLEAVNHSLTNNPKLLINTCPLRLRTNSTTGVSADKVDSQTWWVRFRRMAIRSITILPDVVSLASSRGAPDALARRQSATAVSASLPGARSPCAKPRPVMIRPVLSPRLLGVLSHAVRVCVDP